MDVEGVKVKDAPPEPSTSERLRDAGVEASTSASLTERWRAEIRAQLNLSLPSVASNLLLVSMQMTDLAFIGRVGKDELGAAALGNTVFYLLHYPMIGAMTAVDTLLATAHGASMPAAYGEYTQVGLAFVTACCVPIGACMLFVEHLLLGIEQDPALARLAGAFCKHLAWSLFPYYWTQVLTKYLQAQHVLAPPVYVGIVANGANVFLNWLLIFHLGWGFDGAPVATAICRWFQLACLFAYLRGSRVERARETNPAGGFFLFLFVFLKPCVFLNSNERTNDDVTLCSKKDVSEDVAETRASTTIATAPRVRLKRNGTTRRARAPARFVPGVRALAVSRVLDGDRGVGVEITTLLAGYLARSLWTRTSRCFSSPPSRSCRCRSPWRWRRRFASAICSARGTRARRKPPGA